MFRSHVLLLVHMALAVAMPALAAEYRNYMDYPEWGILLRLSDDGEDLEERALLGQLIDRGEAAHEAMLAVLWQCDDWYYASGAMEMLHCSKGDKAKVWPELRRLLADRLPAAVGDLRDDKTACCRSIAKMLAENGSEDDVRALLPMLAHSNSLLRYEAALYLGQYGDEVALGILKSAKDQNPPPVQERIETVIANIEDRLAKGQNALEQELRGQAP
jgi:hypothetical protein